MFPVYVPSATFASVQFILIVAWIFVGEAILVFPKNSVVSSTGLQLNKQLVDQYTNIVNAPAGSPPAGAPPAEEPGVVKLFDDEEESK